jgi:hypothetical protein
MLEERVTALAPEQLTLQAWEVYQNFWLRVSE